MDRVKVMEKQIVIPTYEPGAADKNPIFLDKRVYQGSTGKIYPYPTIEKISDSKTEKEYKAIYLENDYLMVVILPELGGRIQRAFDKTNGYDFVYYNHVIKPALVGLTGPWISGGIEFNWPQHHRPTTFMPVDYITEEHADGSCTVLVHDVDQMYGTKGIAGFTLYPDKAYIEIRGQLYNRTPLPQTFLWWANPAVPVNDNTQSIFPPDVHAVMDHGKRDVSRFPIATGTYYKYDYSAGVDISRYKNIQVPTSYMAEKSAFDFVGGYDYGVGAGILHVADHHISPGKKQWTWGCGDFGKAWDRNLTDEDGPYIELMTGVFTDNQPDFTWLKPFEEKTFRQYFMPYKAVGEVKNATIQAAVSLQQEEAGVRVCVYATSTYETVVITLKKCGKTVAEAKAKLSPTDIFEQTFSVWAEDETDLYVEVSCDGEILVSYTPVPEVIDEIPDPASEAKLPDEIMTNEELYLTGQHIEQYRHATYQPDPYYLEGLKRDRYDIRINNAYGLLLLRRGLYEEAERYFRIAITRLTSMNPNPYDSEAYYNLGLVLFYQDKQEEAYDAFYKATWTSEQQEMSFYYLAAIDACRGDWTAALEHVEKGLVKNSHNVKARGLKSYILRKSDRSAEAVQWSRKSLTVDPFDFLSRMELARAGEEAADSVLKEMHRLMRNFWQNYVQTARDYAEFGAYEESVSVLALCTEEQPMLYYYKAFYMMKQGKRAIDILAQAEAVKPDYCFPNKLEDIAVLNHAIRRNPDGAKAYYYLGNLFYDKLQYRKATQLWETSVEKDDTYPTAFRNLALACYNKMNRPEEARAMMEKAFALDPEDARIFLELDQLYKKLGMPAEERLRNYQDHEAVFRKRDDLVIEYITLHNLLGHYEMAYQLIMEHKFHPWEGGEGKITTQYTTALTELAHKAIRRNDDRQALELLNRALVYPDNLGEGKLEGTKDNHIYFTMGCAYERLGAEEKAGECFKTAMTGTAEPAGMMYYNDQPADMILYQGLAAMKLGRQKEANSRFYKLIDYGEQHLADDVKIEYFAVSLPDFLIFEDDLKIRNKAHCYYLMGLGHMGLGHREKAGIYLAEALKYDPNHLNCIRYLQWNAGVQH